MGRKPDGLVQTWIDLAKRSRWERAFATSKSKLTHAGVIFFCVSLRSMSKERRDRVSVLTWLKPEMISYFVCTIYRICIEKYQTVTEINISVNPLKVGNPIRIKKFDINGPIVMCITSALADDTSSTNWSRNRVRFRCALRNASWRTDVIEIRNQLPDSAN